MKYYYLLFIMIFQFGINSASALQVDQNNSLEIFIDSIMLNHTGIDKSGATIGIIKDGNLIFQKGYGMANIQLNKANSAQVLYNIASVSKQFTAVAITSLINKGKLSLTDNINKFIPEFPEYGKVITIENLLYHTSGIRDYMVLMWLTGKSFEETFNNKNAFDIVVQQNKLNFNPGDRCVYSNSNYILLAEIIKRVNGKTLREYMNEELFKKLDMNLTGFVGDNIDEKNKAISYCKSDGVYLPYKNNFRVYGDGGMVTTLKDLTRWDLEFYDSTSLVQKILKKGKLNNGDILNYGMGMMIKYYRNELIHTHPGAFLGFRSEILRFPSKKISIICLSNSEEINPESITRKIADVYIFGDKNYDPLVSKKNDSSEVESLINDKNAIAYTGIYEVITNVFIKIQYQDGLLTGQVIGQSKQILHPNGNNNFTIGSTNDTVLFEGFNNDKFQTLTVVQKQGNTIAKRLNLLSPNNYNKFEGSYYCKEQSATYHFYSKDGSLWFKVGSNPSVKVEILTNYNRFYFNYKDLEQATIDFSFGSNGIVDGFILNSSRVNNIQFIRI